MSDNPQSKSLDKLRDQQARMWFHQSYADVCTHKSTYDGLTAQDIVDKSVAELQSLISDITTEARIDELSNLRRDISLQIASGQEYIDGTSTQQIKKRLDKLKAQPLNKRESNE